MDDRYGCFGFTLTVCALLFVLVFMASMVLSSIGIAPVIDANGLSWDNSAYIAHDNNRTQQFVVQQQELTKRSADDNATWRTIAICLAVFGVLALAIVQRGITRRQQMQTQLKLQMYLAYLGVNGEVGRYNGQLGVYDHDHGEFVPAGVALLEMRNN